MLSSWTFYKRRASNVQPLSRHQEKRSHLGSDAHGSDGMYDGQEAIQRHQDQLERVQTVTFQYLIAQWRSFTGHDGPASPIHSVNIDQSRLWNK